ncbi:TlpA family protein disulfide reductase [Macrococcus brunensis]|uniref:TlpA family protein disulfide reductase n=1 Tax=Macrococcus brunensis TaxID=198483 RepID=UPI001EF0BB29|nr:TlpA disulfide reductase family protein [Macrococcus brunensis]ULG72543.1 TlpA family protein disulfide reductase [Macrococcus brunensis]
MKRILMWVLSGIFMLLAAYSVYTVINQDTTELKVSGQAHYINDRNISKEPVQSLEGEKLNLGRELTADINIINFWASWCEPCNKEMPELIKYNQQKPNHIKLIGMNVQDKEKGRDAFLKKYQPDYSIVTGIEDMVKGYKIYNIPTTIFVSKEGKVLSTYVGELDASKLETLVQEVEGRS